VVNLLTHRTPAPQPKQRRRKEETRGGFRLFARKITRPTVRLPAAAYEAAAFLWDTLDWLNPWHHGAANNGELNEDLHYTEPNHLSHHL
jgi:hypothetical protein